MAIFPSTAIPSGAEAFTIDQSLRFEDGDSPNLTWTPGSTATSSRIFTLSCWVKRGNINSPVTIFAGALDGGGDDKIRLDDQAFYIHFNDGSSGTLKTNALFRDPSAWYHLVVAVDTNQSIDTNRVKMYVNNVLQTSFATSSYPAEDYDYTAFFQSGKENSIGMDGDGGAFFDGYIAEVHGIDGTQLTPSSFGEAGDYGEWKPKKVAGLTYGTNGFYLDFANTSTIHTITVGGNTNHSTTQEKIGDTSIRFDGTDDYLTVPDHSVWDFGTKEFTIEAWVRFDAIGSKEFLFSRVDARVGSNYRTIYIMKDDDDTLVTRYGTGGAWNSENKSTETFSVDTWYHIAVTRSGDDFKTYLDGVLLTSMNETSTVDIQGDTPFVFGAQYDSAWNDEFTGYMDEIRISNKCRYTANFTAPTTAFTDDDNTMLLIHSDTTNGSTTFTDSSGAVLGLGNDASTNSNNWTLNNISIVDQMLDSPTNNFCTLNPLDNYGEKPLSEGNLKCSGDVSTCFNTGTFWFETGKWYFESLVTAIGSGSGDGFRVGFSNATCRSGVTSSSNIAWTLAYLSDGKAWDGETELFGAASYVADDIVAMAIDLDAGTPTLKMYKNNVLQITRNISAAFQDVPLSPFIGDQEAGTIGGVMNFGQDSSFAGAVTAQGNQDDNSIGDFYYTPPTDYLALCTSNLPDVAVTPSEHFNTVLYSGDGAVTGVGFQPDFIWIKNRNKAAEGHSLTDAIRGITKNLKSNNTDAEETPSDGLSAFGVDGFTVGTADHCGGSYNYVAWNWNCPTTASGTTTGSGTGKAYSAQYNTDAGFSIIKYLGNDTAGHTIPHRLGSAPEMVVVKGLDTAGVDWKVQHIGLSAGDEVVYLNSGMAENTESDKFGAFAGATTFPLNGSHASVNADDDNYIAYCWHSVDGYSKVGSYTGNADADGAFVYTGFRPAFIMIKSADTGHAWYMTDTTRSTYNVNSIFLEPNNTNAESTSGIDMDVLSNGFKPRDSGSTHNAASNYVYLAFAETPFKYSNAR